MTLTNLPFVESVDGAISSLWAAKNTGDYEADCAKGREFGFMFCAYLANGGTQSSLNNIVKAMSRHKMGGIECGFLTYIAGRTA